MIAIIRIKGRIDIPQDIDETLNRLRLKKKHACVVLKESGEIEGMIKKVRNFVAYGKLNKETFISLVEKRGK